MNRKVFAVTALAGLAGLSGVALETRPVSSPDATAATQAAPNVETVVIQRTVHVRKRVKRKSASASGGARRAVAAAAPAYQPIAVRPAPVAPRVRTSPSSTGSGEDHESEHESGDRGGERDD